MDCALFLSGHPAIFEVAWPDNITAHHTRNVRKLQKMPTHTADQCNDFLLAQARQLIVDHQNPSVAFLQRHLRLGYQRALELMQCLEGEIVTPPHADGWRRMLPTNNETINKMESE